MSATSRCSAREGWSCWTSRWLRVHQRLPLFDEVGVQEFWEDSEHSLGGVYTPDAGYVSGPSLAAVNLAAAASARGAEFRFRSTVTAVEKAGGRVTSVRLSDGTRIPCAVVVNAAGPWSGAVNRLAGVGSGFTVGVRPMRQEVAHVPGREGRRAPLLRAGQTPFSHSSRGARQDACHERATPMTTAGSRCERATHRAPGPESGRTRSCRPVLSSR
jgi:glycine/D-amino acid oxidase-like deaminating enzyme